MLNIVCHQCLYQTWSRDYSFLNQLFQWVRYPFDPLCKGISVELVILAGLCLTGEESMRSARRPLEGYLQQ